MMTYEGSAYAHGREEFQVHREMDYVPLAPMPGVSMARPHACSMQFVAEWLRYLC